MGGGGRGHEALLFQLPPLVSFIISAHIMTFGICRGFSSSGGEKPGAGEAQQSRLIAILCAFVGLRLAMAADLASVDCGPQRGV